jgi:hypothetical protein
MKSETFTASTELEAAESLKQWLARHPLATIVRKIVSTLHSTNSLPIGNGEKISVAINIQYEEAEQGRLQ